MIAATLAALALLGPAAPARPPGVGVGLWEFGVDVYRPAVPAGPLRFNVSNLGEDGHDLVIRRRGSGAVVARFPELGAGKRRTHRATLPRGRYVVFCSIADHEALGMRAPLRVVRR